MLCDSRLDCSAAKVEGVAKRSAKTCQSCFSLFVSRLATRDRSHCGSERTHTSID